jgi:hypothetical protein
MTSSCQHSLALDDAAAAATATTTSLGKDNDVPKVVGSMKSFDCDMLTVAAKNVGLLEQQAPHLSRKVVGEAVCDFYKNHRNNNYTSFAWTCPSTMEMQAFLNTSLLMEQIIMPDLYADAMFGKEHHIAAFWSSVQRNKYCAIDTKVTLQQEEWQHYFNNLGREGEEVKTSRNPSNPTNEKINASNNWTMPFNRAPLFWSFYTMDDKITNDTKKKHGIADLTIVPWHQKNNVMVPP